MHVDQLVRDAWARLATIGSDMAAILLIVLIGTNLIDFATVPAPGEPLGRAFLAAAGLRVVTVFWLMYAVQRRLDGFADALRPRMALARFVALQVALMIGFALAMRLGLMRSAHSSSIGAQWLATFVATSAWLLVTRARLLAPLAALAAGARFADLGSLWDRQEGRLGAITGAVALLIVPAAGIHLAFTLAGLGLALPPGAHLILEVVDGLVQALQLGLSSAIAATVWRAIEAGPPAR